MNCHLTIAASVVMLAGMIACSRPTPDAARRIERSVAAMGSQLTLSAWSADEPETVAAFERVFREFDRLESLLSVWKHNSDVVRLNAAAGAAPVAVSAETLEVLELAHQGSEWTGGKFDITFGALAEVWKFDHDQDKLVPDRAAISARLPRVDYRAVEVNRQAGSAFITTKGVRVHLGGIGKGYAIDRAIAILRAAGLSDFLIQAGGDMYASGTNNGTPWTLGIADPRGTHEAFAAIAVRDQTFSTSGDYERFFMKDGVRYHHLIDPDLGAPARGCRSVTIVADRGVIADILSTGVFIMEPDAGMGLIERLPNVEGVIVTAKNEVLISSGLTDRIEVRRPPTDSP